MAVVSLADVDPSRCDGLVAGARVFAGAAELAAAGGVDAVVVATPASTHVDDVRALHGLTVLVEKPPAATLEGALSLAGLPRPPFVGFNRRYEPELRELRERLDGRRVDLELAFHYRRAEWGPFVADDDALLDVGCHLLDLVRWLTRGEILSVEKATLSRARAELRLGLERGTATVSCATDRAYRELVEAPGFGRHERRGGLRAKLRSLAGRDPLVLTLAAQLRELAAGGGSLATAADGAAVLAAVEAARAAARSGAPAQVSRVPA